jgi:hypothetical protein
MRLGRSARSGMTSPSFVCSSFGDSIADQVDLRLHFRKRMKRSGERRGAEQMVRVVVGDVEARERLAETTGVVDNFACIAQRILRIDRDDLRPQLDEMRVDAPTFLGRGIGMDADPPRRTLSS